MVDVLYATESDKTFWYTLDKHFNESEWQIFYN